ncbi:MAG: DUF4292 domain-containing protein [Chlorobi bacterium]|nr:DUF4292 domain-containing protein [Chlorobiota bacterium]
MIQRVVVPFLLVAMFGGCRTVIPPQRTETTPSDTVAVRMPPVHRPARTAFCPYCMLSGTVEVKSPQLSADGTFKLLLSGRDSLQATLYGPLGIVAARTYCTRNEMIVFDALAMEAYQVQIPFRSLLALPIQREDLFAVLRCELPYPDSTYLAMERRPDGTTILLRRDSTFADVAVVDSEGQLRAYQRKSLDNRLLLAVEYSTYRTWNVIRYPERIRVTAPLQNVEVVIAPDTIADEPIRVPFRFRLPSNVRPKTIE